MLRAYATIFASRPDRELLRRYMSSNIGFRLLKHERSGAYLLVAYAEDVDLSSGSILSVGAAPETKAIKAALVTEEKAGRLSWGAYRLDSFNDAIWLSDIFQTTVLIAYFDDEDSDISVRANCGKLERACLMGTPFGENGENSYEIEMVEVGAVQSRKVGRHHWNDIFEREFKSLFGHPAPDLTDLTYAEFSKIDAEKPKPSRIYNFYQRHERLINIICLPITIMLFFWALVKDHIATKHLIIAGVLAAVMAIVFMEPASTDAGQKVEPTIESLCADNPSAKIQATCNRLKEIKREKAKGPE